MSKRFIDTELYDQEWFLALAPRLKCAWNVLCARCNVIGIWHISMTKLAFEVGEPVTLDELKATFKVEVLDTDKLFIPGFVPFQYGDEAGKLSSKNKFHLSIASKLQSLGLPEPEWKPLKDDDGSGHPIDTVSTLVGSTQGRGKGKGKGQGNSSFEEGSGEKQISPAPIFSIDSLQDVLDAIPIITAEKWARDYPDPAWLEKQISKAFDFHTADPGQRPRTSGQWMRKLVAWLARNWDERKTKASSLDDLVLPDYSTKEPA